MIKLFGVLACLCAALGPAQATEAQINNPATAGMDQLGSGKLTWFSFHIYTATLYSSPGAVLNTLYDRQLLLTVRYRRGASREQLMRSTRKEWGRLHGTASKHARQLDALKLIYPDVRRDDVFESLVMPAGPTLFYLNDAEIGRINDPDFGPAFLDIWLDPRTSEPKLRLQLLSALL